VARERRAYHAARVARLETPDRRVEVAEQTRVEMAHGGRAHVHVAADEGHLSLAEHLAVPPHAHGEERRVQALDKSRVEQARRGEVLVVHVGFVDEGRHEVLGGQAGLRLDLLEQVRPPEQTQRGVGGVVVHVQEVKDVFHRGQRSARYHARARARPGGVAGGTPAMPMRLHGDAILREDPWQAAFDRHLHAVHQFQVVLAVPQERHVGAPTHRAVQVQQRGVVKRLGVKRLETRHVLLLHVRFGQQALLLPVRRFFVAQGADLFPQQVELGGAGDHGPQLVVGRHHAVLAAVPLEVAVVCEAWQELGVGDHRVGRRRIR